MVDISILVLIGLAAGALSGVLGIGGGILIIPALVSLLGFSQIKAQGTSLGLLLLPIGIMAVINYYKAGNMDIKAALLMVIPFVIGSYLSSKFVLSLPELAVKRIFAVFLVIYAVKLFWGK